MKGITETALVLWYNKGLRHVDQGRHDKAIACFDHVLELDPHDANTLYAKANSLAKSGNLEESLLVYDKCLDISPQHAAAWCNKGYTLYLLERYQEAVICLDQSLLCEPFDAASWLNKAMAVDALGQREEADHCFRIFLLNATAEMGREVKVVRQLLQEPGPTQSIVTYQPRKVV